MYEATQSRWSTKTPGQKIGITLLILFLVASCIYDVFDKLSKAQDSIVGTWSCNTQNPDGSVYQNTFVFGADGYFADHEEDISLHGTYHLDGRAISITLRQIDLENKIIATQQDSGMDGEITELERGKLIFEATSRRNRTTRNSICIKPNQ